MTFNLDEFRNRFDAMMSSIRSNIAELDAASGQLRRAVNAFTGRAG